jgi:molybdopterin synthase catalytic subunit
MGGVLEAPVGSDVWTGLSKEALPVDAAGAWAVLPSCGAVVSFVGTVRDSSEGRQGVAGLAYEAYVEQVERTFDDVAASARARWPELGRVVVLHRVGALELTDAAVVTVASAPHRDVAFEAARYLIDTVKATAPIWKSETWEGGVDWGVDGCPVEPVERVR